MAGFGHMRGQAFKQERLAKEDIRLLIEVLNMAQQTKREYAGSTRIELLIGKLKRMLSQ